MHSSFPDPKRGALALPVGRGAFSVVQEVNDTTVTKEPRGASKREDQRRQAANIEKELESYNTIYRLFGCSATPGGGKERMWRP